MRSQFGYAPHTPLGRKIIRSPKSIFSIGLYGPPNAAAPSFSSIIFSAIKREALSQEIIRPMPQENDKRSPVALEQCGVSADQRMFSPSAARNTSRSLLS